MGSKHDTEKPNIPIETEVGSASDVGLVRVHNEDALLVQNSVLDNSNYSKMVSLYAVADGLGGHQAGEVASNLAIGVFADQVGKAFKLLGYSSPSLSERDSMSNILAEAVKAANMEIYARNQSIGHNMGTTLVAMLLVGKVAYIANVGDSRAYLLDKDRLQQITTDHSLVASLVTAGQIAPEEIYTHPQRNIITRCLGTEGSVDADLFVKELKPGMAIMLCSDGLWEMVRDDKLKDVLLQSKSPQEACDRLVELANQNGGVDNISVVTVKNSTNINVAG